jgi:hypothetical protein
LGGCGHVVLGRPVRLLCHGRGDVDGDVRCERSEVSSWEQTP